jgi:2-iminobutanoate/2-iminopropanoate deaminase
MTHPLAMEICKVQVGNGLDVNKKGFTQWPAIAANGFVYTFGITPIDTETLEIMPGDIEFQTRRVLDVLSEVLEAAGSSLSRTLHATVYLRDIQDDYAGFNKAFDHYFAHNPVPRTVVQAVIRSPIARVQIQIVALQEPGRAART